jgi:hypothetical protein
VVPVLSLRGWRDLARPRCATHVAERIGRRVSGASESSRLGGGLVLRVALIHAVGLVTRRSRPRGRVADLLLEFRRVALETRRFGVSSCRSTSRMPKAVPHFSHTALATREL